MDERYENCFKRNFIFRTQKIDLTEDVNEVRTDPLIKNQTSTAIYVKGIEKSINQNIEKLLIDVYLTIANLIILVDKTARANTLRDEEGMDQYLSNLKDRQSVITTLKCLNVKSFLRDKNQGRSYKSHIEENCNQLTCHISKERVEIYFKPRFSEEIRYFYDEDKVQEDDDDKEQEDENDDFHKCDLTEDVFKKQMKNICIKIVKDNAEINNEQTFQFTEFRNGDEKKLVKIKTIAARERTKQISLETQLKSGLGPNNLNLSFNAENGICIARITGKKKNIDLAKDLLTQKLRERIERFQMKAIPYSIYDELKKKKISLSNESPLWESADYTCKKYNDDKEYEDYQKVILITGSSKSVDKMYKLIKEMAYEGERYISGEISSQTGIKYKLLFWCQKFYLFWLIDNSFYIDDINNKNFVWPKKYQEAYEIMKDCPGAPKKDHNDFKNRENNYYAEMC